MREMATLNKLIERYSQDFWAIVNFPNKVDSMVYFLSPKLKDKLDYKYMCFTFEIDEGKYEQYDLGEKLGEDIYIAPQKQSIKKFLNG